MEETATATKSAPMEAEPFPQVPPARSVAEVRAHPNFAATRRRFLLAFATDPQAQGSSPAMRLLSDPGRIALFSTIVTLYFHYDPDERATWPTIGLIRNVFLPLGLSSARRLDAILARLQSIGLLSLVDSPADRRLRLVLPTEHMLDLDLDLLARQFSCLDSFLPGTNIGGPLREGDRRYQRALRHVASRTRSLARQPLELAGRLRPILARQDGVKLLAPYLVAAHDGDPTRVSLSFDTLGLRSRTSRTHIRNLFNELAQLGLARQHRPGGHQVELLPELLDLADNFIASAIANYARGWAIACWLVETDPRYAQYFPPAATD
ncbi:hypothetical protein [Devosia sp. Root635]|uniref:hypothetical protein n=1 Tax=Devosia sp. Root635 TaxID=1736575 RepID=UPI0007017938|nr:hypothetical protein [Devosia sp. Root635]KRA55324.1 hypothetical protein ASD80_12950 [Devosia sp. Root635]